MNGFKHVKDMRTNKPAEEMGSGEFRGNVSVIQIQKFHNKILISYNLLICIHMIIFLSRRKYKPIRFSQRLSFKWCWLNIITLAQDTPLKHFIKYSIHSIKQTWIVCSLSSLSLSICMHETQKSLDIDG
jgi:hypothetical protein